MLKNLIGQTFGRLTVVKRVENDKYRRAVWLCQCSCEGKFKEVTSQGLLSGNTQSCGCLVPETAKRVNTRHGGCANGNRTPEYMAYINAKRRCIDPNAQSYKRYGGRGIKFLFTSYEQWIAELGSRPTKKHSVDRKNNDGHYEPGNVRWATKKEQNANRRFNNCTALKARIAELEAQVVSLTTPVV